MSEPEAPPLPVSQKDNPFSYKSFLTRRAGEEEEERSGGGGTGERRKTTGRGRVAAKETSSSESLPFPDHGGQGKDGANPFSFKNFVARSSKDKADDSGTSSDEDHDLPLPLLQSDPPLRATPSKPRGKSSLVKSKSSLSSTTRLGSAATGKTTRLDVQRSPKTGSKISKPRSPRPLFESSSSSDEDTGPLLPVATKPTPGASMATTSDPLGVLGDGLNLETVSLVSLPGKGVTMQGRREGRRGKSTSELNGQFDAVTRSRGAVASLTDEDPFPDIRGTACSSSEMEELRRALQACQQELRKEKEANKTLKTRVKALKKKEAEDTKALEDMVAKVEENLVATTKRATRAETTIAQLKQEVLSLQAQLTAQSPQSVHHQYEETLRGVREKAGYVSQQLNFAALQADQSIRDLLSGVETLKNVAQVMEYIDSISTVKD